MAKSVREALAIGGEAGGTKDYCYPTVLDGIMVSSFHCSAGNFMWLVWLLRGAWRTNKQFFHTI